ncbi:MAG: hypothetical protein HY832_03785 [Candidatus Aenigmarchaeota archaeon]|nr:hypothetical protein [Candidatus Aenigmarchaeota archaeon]
MYAVPPREETNSRLFRDEYALSAVRSATRYGRNENMSLSHSIAKNVTKQIARYWKLKEREKIQKQTREPLDQIKESRNKLKEMESELNDMRKAVEILWKVVQENDVKLSPENERIVKAYLEKRRKLQISEPPPSKLGGF